MSAVGITQALASFVSDTPPSALRGEPREVLGLSLLDWAACGLAGVGEPVSRKVASMVLADGGAADASVFGQAAKLPARQAALANGTASHALDYDDTHFDYIGHPSVVVFSAALAVAERKGASGRAFLDAALIGMETACRVGRWLGLGHYNHGFHQTATAGAFGAAAAAARLLGLDAERTAHALGLTATRASGLKSQFGTMGKPYNAGIAASNGIEAAQLAADGFVSRPDGIECVQGFAETHAGAMGDPADALAGLGAEFRFRFVQHKFHACCHGTHPTLEAIASAIAGENPPVADVAAVTLTVAPKWLRVCDLPEPKTGLEAKFSYRLTTAMALLGRDTGALSTFSDAACRDPGLMMLRDRVRVETDPALADTAARVRIALGSGRVLDAAHDLDAPISLAEKERKLRAKAAGLLTMERADAVWAAVAALDESGISPFAMQLRRAQ
ncbi:MAG: MmgE/PrpD family protein [Beijerinckiaceae bacterium]